MKPASEFIHDLPGRRFTGWGIAVGVLSTLLLAFLVVGPVVEKNAYLGALDDLENGARLSRGLLTLCNTSTHTTALNERLAKKLLPQRLLISQTSAELDCLQELRPAFQAEHYLHTGGIGSVASAIALGPKAVEPAIVALESENTEVRARAAKVLVALDEFINEDRRTRIKTRLIGLEEEGIAPLRQNLGLPPLPSKADPSQALPLPGSTVPDPEEEGPSLGTGGFKLELDLPAALPTLPAPSPPTQQEPPAPAVLSDERQPDERQEEAPPQVPDAPEEAAVAQPAEDATAQPAQPAEDATKSPEVLYDREATPRLQMPQVPEKEPKKQPPPAATKEQEKEEKPGADTAEEAVPQGEEP